MPLGKPKGISYIIIILLSNEICLMMYLVKLLSVCYVQNSLTVTFCMYVC